MSQKKTSGLVIHFSILNLSNLKSKNVKSWAVAEIFSDKDDDTKQAKERFSRTGWIVVRNQTLRFCEHTVCQARTILGMLVVPEKTTANILMYKSSNLKYRIFQTLS
jgi:hypothetical protein